MTSVSTEKFDFNKNWKTKKQHNQNTSYHQKTFYMKIHQGKTQKKCKINQSKPGVCAVLFILWFVFGVLVLFLVFLFVFWVSSFLFFCLQCLHFSWFNYFSNMLLGLKPFSLQRASKQIPGSIQSWDRKKNRSKMYERKGGQPHPSLEYMSGFDMLRL